MSVCNNNKRAVACIDMHFSPDITHETHSRSVTRKDLKYSILDWFPNVKGKRTLENVGFMFEVWPLLLICIENWENLPGTGFSFLLLSSFLVFNSDEFHPRISATVHFDMFWKYYYISFLFEYNGYFKYLFKDHCCFSGIVECHLSLNGEWRYQSSKLNVTLCVKAEI